MEMTFTPMEERIAELRDNMKLDIQYNSEMQKKINFIRFNAWLRDHPTVIASAHIQPRGIDRLTVNLSNSIVEEIIENVLGPYYRKYSILWRLSVEGTEEDPVFVFRDVKHPWSDIEFRVKEGEFKTCKVNRIVKEVINSESYPIYEMELICE